MQAPQSNATPQAPATTSDPPTLAGEKDFAAQRKAPDIAFLDQSEVRGPSAGADGAWSFVLPGGLGGSAKPAAVGPAFLPLASFEGLFSRDLFFVIYYLYSIERDPPRNRTAPCRKR